MMVDASRFIEKCAICGCVISYEQARQAGHKCAKCLAAWNALYEPVSHPVPSSPFRYKDHSRLGRRGTAAACPDDDDDD